VAKERITQSSGALPRAQVDDRRKSASPGRLCAVLTYRTQPRRDPSSSHR
jgi:hypothetical protein